MSARLTTALLAGSALFLALQAHAQESALQIPGLREQALVLHMVARIVESQEGEVWNSTSSKITLPGRPVSLKLVGENIVVVVQFTPYLRHGGRNVLVAQGQIWVDMPNVGMRYQTTMQTIPLDYGEQIFFFPLGQVSAEGTAHIEIQLMLQPYTEAPAADPPPEAKGETPH